MTVPFDVLGLWFLASEATNESAGHMVVRVVTGQMVGDRRSPGATILGVETIYLLRQPSFLVPPTGREHLEESWTVYEMAGSVHPDGFDVAVSLVLTVVAAAIRVGLDVAASLKLAVAAEASGKRKGVAASVADCCGSGFPCG